MKPLAPPGFASVPAEVREEIKAYIINAPLVDYGTLMQITKYILAQLLGGNISEAQADSARRYLELLITAIALDINERRRAESGDDDDDKPVLATDVIKRLKSAEDQAKKLTKQLSKPTFVVDVAD